MPAASPAPSAAPASASTRLSVSACRNSRQRPAPSAERIAYSGCRCSPRVSSRPETLAQAIRNTMATDPKSGTSSRLPARFSTSCTGATAALTPCSVGSDWAGPAESVAISVLAVSIVASPRSRATALPAPPAGRDSSGATPNQKSTNALRS